jgi:putative endonuclease
VKLFWKKSVAPNEATDSTRAIGARGEALAIARLKKLGYRVLEQNFLCRGGEIDIVARQGEVLVFVEVKARGSDAFGSPLEAVGPTKRRRLERAAQVYLSQKKLHGVPVRFDLVGVRLDRDPPEVEVVPNAFDVRA